MLRDAGLGQPHIGLAPAIDPVRADQAAVEEVGIHSRQFGRDGHAQPIGGSRPWRRVPGSESGTRASYSSIRSILLMLQPSEGRSGPVIPPVKQTLGHTEQMLSGCHLC